MGTKITSDASASQHRSAAHAARGAPGSPPAHYTLLSLKSKGLDRSKRNGRAGCVMPTIPVMDVGGQWETSVVLYFWLVFPCPRLAMRTRSIVHRNTYE